MFAGRVKRGVASLIQTNSGSRQLSSLRGAAQRRTSAFGSVEPIARQALWDKDLTDSQKWWDNKRRYPEEVELHGELGPAAQTGGGCTTSDQLGWDRKADYERSLEVRTWERLCQHGQLAEAVEALDLLVQERSYVPPAPFYHVLKKCIAQKDVVVGRRAHALALKSGHESNTFLANHIIRMYASQGRLQEAVQVFTKLDAPDCFMWASIILAHAEHGQPTQAIRIYEQMRLSRVKADNYIFVAVLKACGAAADLACGKQVHAAVLESRVEPNIFVGNALLDMYAKCGSLQDARLVFDGLSTKDVVSWTSMIAGYAQHGRGQEALTLYASMQQEGATVPNDVTFVCLLKACASVGALHDGKELHRQIQHRGLATDVAVSNCLVDMYAKCGSIGDARKVFDRMPKRDLLSWNSMIAGYAQQGLGREALALYGCMQQEGTTLADNVTFVCLLKSCAAVRDLRAGKDLHGQIQERGLEADTLIGNSLVDMYAKCGSLEDARRLFDRLPIRNVVTWNAMITGYAQQGVGEQALSLYASMQQEAMTAASTVTFVSLLKACASVGALKQGKQLHLDIQERGLELDVVVGSSLIDMYGKCGSVEDARKVFDRLPTKNVVTWNALLNGYSQHNHNQMAMQCFKEMQRHGVEPDETTFICLLVACSHQGLVKEGQQYFGIMVEEYGLAPTIYHYNCMVDLMARSGRLDEAERFLLTMPLERDAVGWTSLLTACKAHGDVERGWRCFDRLIQLEPQNAAAYMLLANTYADAGRWSDVDMIERLRVSAGACKKPAMAWIEVKNTVHSFVVGEERNDLSGKLKSVNLQFEQEGGHVPHTELVLKPVSEREKEDALCGHAEKLALAFGLLNTPNGSPLLVTKNLRMCDDCHSGTKIMSRIEKREIIVRDAHHVHHFVNGFCSCGDGP